MACRWYRGFLNTELQQQRPVYRSPPVRRVNSRTLTLFGASNLAHLVGYLTQDWCDDLFINLIVAMYQLQPGNSNFTAHWVTRGLSGQRLDV